MITTTNREMNLETFLREYSIPVIDTKELDADIWQSVSSALATLYEEALQRKDCWRVENRRKFILSANRGLTPLSTIIVANVRSCLELSQKMGDEVSIAYYANILNRGFKYISIDGKNRTITLHRFIENVFTVSGEYINQDGEIEIIENAYFKDLSDSLQKHFLKNTLVRVTELTVLQEDLYALFLNLHEGMPLNAQEKRNASTSPIAQWVRQLAAKYSQSMPRILKAQEIERMADFEWVAKSAMHCISAYGSTPSGTTFSANPFTRPADVDAWYKLGTGFRSLGDNNIPYLASELTRAESIMDECHKVFAAQKTPPSKPISNKMASAVAMVVEEVLDAGNYIADHEAFFDELYEIDQLLIAESDTQRAADTKAAILAGTKPPASSRYYSHWSHVPHQPQERAKRKKALMAEVINNVAALTIR